MSDKSVVVVNRVPVEVKNPLRSTKFDELIIAQKTRGFALSSYEGASVLRNSMDLVSGAVVETNFTGEIKVATGVDGGSSARLVTNERGVYQPGSQSQAGVGIRVGSLPVGGQEARWGYFDSQNGFGWGIDATSLYVFIKRGGVIVEKIYQADWNGDPLNGEGLSGRALNLLEGVVFQSDIIWYGYGPIMWSVLKNYSEFPLSNSEGTVRVHEYQVANDSSYKGPSIYQPNLPITVEVDNGGTSGSWEIFVGGRQFSTIGGDQSPPVRQITDNVEDYTLTTAQGVWEPILAFRKQDMFNGFPNPINVFANDILYKTNEDTSFRLTIGATITDATWAPAPSWGPMETASEVAKVSNGLTLSDTGFITPPYVRAAATSQGRGSTENVVSSTGNSRIVLGRTQNLVLWARPDTGNATTVSVSLNWTESF